MNEQNCPAANIFLKVLQIACYNCGLSRNRILSFERKVYFWTEKNIMESDDPALLRFFMNSLSSKELLKDSN